MLLHIHNSEVFQCLCYCLCLKVHEQKEELPIARVGMLAEGQRKEQVKSASTITKSKWNLDAVTTLLTLALSLQTHKLASYPCYT